MSDKSPNPFSFFSELKRRKVVKAALVYVAVAFAILQASDIIFPRLGLPDWTVTFVLILLIIVFILVVVLTWVYDITPEGIKVTQTLEEKPQENDENEAKTDEVKKTIPIPKAKPRPLWINLFRKYIFPIFVLVVLLILVFNWQRFKQVIAKDDPKRVMAKSHVENAVNYFNNNDFEAAKAELDLAMANDPKYSYAWSTLAAVSVKEGNLNKAILQTIEALNLDPTNYTAAYNMAIALDDKKDYQQAIVYYTKAIKIDSTLVPAYSALGRLYNTINQPIEAILILSQAKNKYPESNSIYLIYKNIGNAYLLQEQIDTAIKYLELSREINKGEPETNLFLARAYEAAGQMTRSIELWDNYIKLETDSIKINEAKKHLKEITIKHLQEIIK